MRMSFLFLCRSKRGNTPTGAACLDEESVAQEIEAWIDLLSKELEQPDMPTSFMN